jgi:hypothetical protein
VLLPQSFLHRYDIGSSIGQGACGDVFAGDVRHASVAIKFVNITKFEPDVVRCCRPWLLAVVRWRTLT